MSGPRPNTINKHLVEMRPLVESVCAQVSEIGPRASKSLKTVCEDGFASVKSPDVTKNMLCSRTDAHEICRNSVGYGNLDSWYHSDVFITLP
ncbi:hypothetical protein TNCV_1017941 [Trichonephila clavipes]|uniref:Uncharacterized protein n=1 Tax=Trichonephila clavipes TaxID=2585209 RepID=A0A8X6VYE6_TRICX|nr:hypothetical protein TNCV_1017941 [Trichonephila clavipes]